MTTTRSSNVPSGQALKGCGAPPRPSPNRRTSCTGRPAFPGVWRRWQDEQPVGGFDAVIGNPPWDRIEQQEVEWFALRDYGIAHAATGAQRKTLIDQRTREGDERALEYAAVHGTATAMRKYVRSSGSYPLLSGGRINLYSLFVERAMRPHQARWFSWVSSCHRGSTQTRLRHGSSSSFLPRSGWPVFSTSRIAALEQGYPPSSQMWTHGSSSAPSSLAVRSGSLTRPSAPFFLPNTETIKDPDRCFPLSPNDFTRVNPNTATAPIFRTRRDAEITRGIYARHPVLVDRSGGEERRAWPIRFMQGLFNMTADSHLFRTSAQLDAQGFYPVQGNRWKRGEEHVPASL